jgi:carboxymethylenebutenolidase
MTPGDVSIPAPGGALPGYLAAPAGAGPWPGVVVLHDLVGMSRDLRDQVDWLAGSGYLTVAPDLFRGNRRPACMFRMIRETWRHDGPTFVDIQSVGGWLADRPDCTGRIGVVGFCMGGGFALLLAIDDRFDAASVNYGPVPARTYTEATFVDACPIVASYGAEDRGNRGVGERLERILTAVGVEHDVKTYPGAGHSFMNDHDPADLPALLALQFRLTGNPYHEPSARDARSRILGFFGAHLGPRAGQWQASGSAALDDGTGPPVPPGRRRP